MMNYEKNILETLIDKYEKSKSFIGENKVSQSFSIKLETQFPKYADDAEYDIFLQINEVIQNLLDRKYITASKKKNGIFESVSLNIKNIDAIYKHLNRTPKTNQSLIDILNRYSSKNDILSKYCKEHKLYLLWIFSKIQVCTSMT